MTTATTQSRVDQSAELMAGSRQSVREIGEINGGNGVGGSRDVARFDGCRLDLHAFLLTYMPAAFYLKMSPDHLTVIAKLQKAILSGGLFAEAMPRGQGKTTILVGAALWAILYAHRRFVVIIGAESQHAKGIMASIMAEVQHNERIQADFPLIAAAVSHIDGIAQRAAGQLYQGKRTNICWKKDKVVCPAMEGSECSGAVIIPRGLTGAIRGLQEKTVDGDVLRPDFVLLDDPQTEESAKSPTQCKARSDLIAKAVLGLAGPDKKLSALIACTIIEKDDLSDMMLNRKIHPEWQGETMRMVEKWPDKQDNLWMVEYRELRRDGLAAGDDGAEATKFYVEHRKEMDEGAVLNWPERFNEDELSALQHAENLLIDRGPFAFFSEYQNDPQEAKPALYDLTTEIVLSRLNGRQARDAPSDAPFITGFVDINPAYGLNWCVVAWRNDICGYVLAHGKFPEKEEVPLVEKDLRGGDTEAVAIYAGLDALMKIMKETHWTRDGEPARIDIFMVDCGYQQATVGKFCKAADYGFRVAASRGRDSKRYKPSKPIGPAGDRHHVTEYATVERVLVHDTDHWRMHVQKAFLLPVGAPGGLSLYGTEKESRVHKRFAEHICGEILVEFLKGDIADSYNWAMKPGEKNDLLDCAVGCAVAASYLGASATHHFVKPAPQAKRQKRQRRLTQHG